ncbi:MAG: hypothetical protein D6727_03745, partial [Gammaproteobacteria bacterium]
MDNLRLFLWLGLGLLLFMSWQTWQLDYATPPAAEPATAAPAAATSGGEESPAATAAEELPALPEAAEAAPAAAQSEAGAATPRQLVSVHTDVLDVEIDLSGGNLVRASLPRYPVHKDQPDVPVVLLSPEPEDYYVIRSGLRALAGPEPGPAT